MADDFHTQVRPRLEPLLALGVQPLARRAQPKGDALSIAPAER